MTSDKLHRVPAYICSHIFDASRPVLLVVHDDGDWFGLAAPDDNREPTGLPACTSQLESRNVLREVGEAKRDRFSPVSPERRCGGG